MTSPRQPSFSERLVHFGSFFAFVATALAAFASTVAEQPNPLTGPNALPLIGLGLAYLVVGLVASVHDGGHEVEFRLIDPDEETTLVGYTMPSAPDALPETAHRIADLIMMQLDAGTPVVASDADADGYRQQPSTA